MYKGCTSGAHRVSKGKSDGHPVSIPCTPLVHGVRRGGEDGGRLPERGRLECGDSADQAAVGGKAG
ncbi:MAG: hypothetical protein QM840_13090 [Verrucomicrobiota bacterium]|nr:hypothetical protein [Verrucomicrobiota bacterium]